MPEDGLTFFWTLQKLLNNFLAALEMEIWYFDVEESSDFFKYRSAWYLGRIVSRIDFFSANYIP